MSSKPKLPTIEFNETNTISDSNSWKSTSESVRRALESYGCFVLSCENTKINSELQEAVFGLMEDLFRLPPETKKKYTCELPGFGYWNYPVMPLFEYFGLEDGHIVEVQQNFTSLMWPDDGNDKFCETLNTYCKLLLEIDHTVKKMVASSYGLEKYSHTLIESSMYMARLMKYHSPSRENETDIGLLPHRDKSFVAVIGTNEAKGLQIETPDGDWIDFEPCPGKFMVLAGEPLTAWSNGRIYSPLHKVIARGETKEKYSIGLFSFIRGILKVPEELVDDQNPLKFKPFSNLEFIDYCNEAGPKMREAIRKYCGVLSTN